MQDLTPDPPNRKYKTFLLLKRYIDIFSVIVVFLEFGSWMWAISFYPHYPYIGRIPFPVNLTIQLKQVH
jgi:hypothetical protein